MIVDGRGTMDDWQRINGDYGLSNTCFEVENLFGIWLNWSGFQGRIWRKFPGYLIETNL